MGWPTCLQGHFALPSMCWSSWIMHRVPAALPNPPPPPPGTVRMFLAPCSTSSPVWRVPWFWVVAGSPWIPPQWVSAAFGGPLSPDTYCPIMLICNIELVSLCCFKFSSVYPLSLVFLSVFQIYAEFCHLSRGCLFRIHVLTKAKASSNSFGVKATQRFGMESNIFHFENMTAKHRTWIMDLVYFSVCWNSCD